jgi:NAD(P)-dependent dehydrogenase (short-subunit alcohol dehydrogenase family)
MRGLHDKAAAVTGAASGIGRATAVRLAEEGASVACLDLQLEAAEETAKAIIAAGGQAFAQSCNVADPADGAAAIAAVVERYGRLDVLCNIAGIGHFADDRTETLEWWNRIITVNLTGTFLMSQAALPHLIESKGTIVNTASTAGMKGQPWSSAYSASKGGVIALTQTMAVNWGRQGVRVNCVAPGGVTTPITDQFATVPEGADLDLMTRIMPFSRFGEPDELAAAFAFLASDEASYVNGFVMRVDGGMHM